MRLNVLSQAIIVGAALRSKGIRWINPRIGTPHLVNENLFKYSVTWGTPKAVLVERICLNTLFDSIAQDITLFSFDDPLAMDLSAIQRGQGINPAMQEYIVDDIPHEVAPPTDVLGGYFLRWRRLVGLNDLKPKDVLLSMVGNNHMMVDARHSPLYCGTVSIKIK